MARILIIDDETNIRMMVRLALQHVGHEVETAPDGAEGLEKFGTGVGWELVLLDQRMPGLKGMDVLRQIVARDPDARVIMITAFGTVDLAVEAMKAGARDFLRKPFTAETLRGAVKAVLARDEVERVEEQDSVGPVTYGLTTLNGFRVESSPAPPEREAGAISFSFALTSPDGRSDLCVVSLPAYVVELVKAHAGCERMPGGDRFWQALCEEVAANYVWQNAGFPPDGAIHLDDLSAPLRRWVDAVVGAQG